MTLAFAAGNDLVMWYELADDPAGTGFEFGLLTGDGRPKPSFTAYQLLSQKLAGLTASACPETGHPGIEAYRFHGADGTRREIVAWSMDGRDRFLPVRADQVVRNSRDGHRTIVTDGDDGRLDGQVQILVSRKPVILDVTLLPALAGISQPFKIFLPLMARQSCG